MLYRPYNPELGGLIKNGVYKMSNEQIDGQVEQKGKCENCGSEDNIGDYHTYYYGNKISSYTDLNNLWC